VKRSSLGQIYLFCLSIVGLLAGALGLSGCSLFWGPNYEPAPPPSLNQNHPTTCRQGEAPFWAASNPSLGQAFAKFLAAHPTLTFIERAVLWALLQMNVRPDLASPAATLQIVIALPGQAPHYYDFAPGPQAPYLAALKYLLQHYRHQHTLSSLAALLDRSFKEPLLIDAEFSLFLQQHQAAVASPLGHKYFFKGDQVLRPGEGLPRLAFYDLVATYKQDRAATEQRKLYPINGRPHLRCNQDLSLDQHKKYQIAAEIVPYHFFQYTDEAGHTFLAASSLRPRLVGPHFKLGPQFTFAGSAPAAPAAFCLWDQGSYHLQMLAAHDRDPAQHLLHLIALQPSIMRPKDLAMLNQLGRYLFLHPPARLLVESTRMSEEQIEHFFALNFPLYHVRQMGNLWFTWQGAKQRGIVTDVRHPTFMYCPKSNEQTPLN